MTHEEWFQKALTYEDLIVPKLRAIYNSGDGATFHEAANRMDVIAMWKAIYNLRLKEGRIDELIPAAVTFYEYIRSAEIWMCKLAGVEYKWPHQK